MAEEWNHFDAQGNAVMVDVSGKEITSRTASAVGTIRVNREIMEAVLHQTVKKGDVLGVARVAGIMAAKRTWELIPMCHPLAIRKCSIEFETDPERLEIRAISQVKVEEKTGVEMEALTAVTAALLTIYDMCKAIDKHMEITEVHLLSKTGGKSGDFSYD
ncbi:MAG: cyclic pyranopterin monophosphate synthase MoaC [Candidatus Limivivens sp.]|nr:cyclic pyranopterin monophosphate synthase MoaC [Candidatus Limivivens sp.]